MIKASNRKYFSQPSTPHWRTIYIPLSQIENIYGHGNFDDAGDELVYTLREICGIEDVERGCRIDIDSSHANPWFHVLIFEVADMSEEEFEKLIARVKMLKLWDDSFQIIK